MPRTRPSPQFWIVLALALLAASPLTAPGYFSQAHDARHSVYLLQMFDAALRDGQPVPRWGADVTFGYGYPVWIIFAPLPYYAAELFHLIGFDFAWSVKMVYFVALIAAALAMYLFASRVMGRTAGMVAAIAYTYVPYHLVDLYVRAAWPETLSFVFLPLILWALHELVTTRSPRYVALVALPYGALMLTHVVMTALLSLVAGAYLLFLWGTHWREAPADRRGRLAFLLSPILGLALGVGVGALFWLPSVLEQPFLSQAPFTGDFFDFRKHFVSFSQLISPFWGYGYAGINGNDQFSLQLGIMPLALALISLTELPFARTREARAHLVLFGLITAGAVFGMLSLSQPLWELVARVGQYIQFPWRLLIVASFTLAFMSGAATARFADLDLFPSLAVSLLLVLAVFPYAQPQYTEARFSVQGLMDFQLNEKELLGDTIWTNPETRPATSPLVSNYLAGEMLQKVQVLDGGTAEMIEHRPNRDTARITSDMGSRVLFLTHFFPGWYATVDGQPVSAEPYGDQGLILVHVPAGAHVVETRYGYTWPRAMGETVTALCTFAALAILWRRSRRT